MEDTEVFAFGNKLEALPTKIRLEKLSMLVGDVMASVESELGEMDSEEDEDGEKPEATQNMETVYENLEHAVNHIDDAAATLP